MKVISGRLHRRAAHDGNATWQRKSPKVSHHFVTTQRVDNAGTSQIGKQLNGDPGPIRTADLRFRKPMLYPSELRGHTFTQQLAAAGVNLISPSFKC